MPADSKQLKLNEIDNKPPEYMKAIGQFLKNPRGFFLIAGKNGNGKTFTAQAIYEYFSQDQFHDNKFWNQADLNLKWQDILFEKQNTRYFLDQIVSAPLLVLDDIGTRKPSDAFMDFLYMIADKRYDAREHYGTIITTNISSQEMREKFSDAFVSRVSSGICIRHDGPDRRRSLDKF